MSTIAQGPRLKAPQGACDTHIHVYDRRYPTAKTALMTPPDASVADYKKVQVRLGLSRVVVVQPTTYGTDNRCTVEAIAALGIETTRGIAVVDTSVTDTELARLTKAGIRGLRCQMLPGGAFPWEMVEELAARIQPHGWHVQLQMDGRLFPERAALIKRLPGTVVIDHTGKFLEPVAVDHAGFKTLLGFLDSGRFYVKLSAPYETSKLGPPLYKDVGTLAKALAKGAPDRVLWASNWPHPGQTSTDDAMMLDLLLDWLDSDAARTKALVDNPARLYGF
jgi:D-galactarolactone isomerase